MNLLTTVTPGGVLFLGKCGGLKKSTELGHFILPIAAIRGGSTRQRLYYSRRKCRHFHHLNYTNLFRRRFLTHDLDYRTGVVYTTNRRLWEWDEGFKKYLQKINAIGIDMETATLFRCVVNHTPRGALLLVSDIPIIPEGIKTEISDKHVTRKFATLHLELGIEAMTELGQKGEQIKHFTYE